MDTHTFVGRDFGSCLFRFLFLSKWVSFLIKIFYPLNSVDVQVRVLPISVQRLPVDIVLLTKLWNSNFIDWNNKSLPNLHASHCRKTLLHYNDWHLDRFKPPPPPVWGFWSVASWFQQTTTTTTTTITRNASHVSSSVMRLQRFPCSGFDWRPSRPRHHLSSMVHRSTKSYLRIWDLAWRARRVVSRNDHKTQVTCSCAFWICVEHWCWSAPWRS